MLQNAPSHLQAPFTKGYVWQNRALTFYSCPSEHENAAIVRGKSCLTQITDKTAAVLFQLIRYFGGGTLVSPCRSTTPGAHPSFISTLILGAPSPGKQTHYLCWQPFPSCCDLGEPQPVESSPPGEWVGTQGVTHAWQRGQPWQEVGSCLCCQELGST